jgi:GT2 family glycosyltransferase
LEPLQKTSVVGVQGGVTVPDATNALGWAESILGFPGGGIKRILDSNGKAQETKEISTLNCAYRKWVIDKIGGFDDHLKTGDEDSVLARQVKNYGRFVFVPDALVKHISRGDLIKIWSWFVKRGRAEMNTLRIRGKKEYSIRVVLKSSIVIKICLLILAGIVIQQNLLVLLLIALACYCVLQYVRYFNAWKRSGSPLKSLLVIPLVKLVMDIAMDWGRVRGLIFE